MPHLQMRDVFQMNRLNIVSAFIHLVQKLINSALNKNEYIIVMVLKFNNYNELRHPFAQVPKIIAPLQKHRSMHGAVHI